jgi:hypothetical protein
MIGFAVRSTTGEIGRRANPRSGLDLDHVPRVVVAQR